MRGCSCWSASPDNPGIAIDGGFEYCKVSHGSKSKYSVISNYDIGEISKEALYHDWNMQNDNYGLIMENEDTTRWYNCPHCDAGYPDQECICKENEE